MKNIFAKIKHASLLSITLYLIFQAGSICYSQTPELLHRKIDSLKTYNQDLEHRLETLEKTIDELEDRLEPLENFILPGGIETAALLHYARTISRKTERVVNSLKKKEDIGNHVLPYLNRLSDLLFVMARYENQRAGIFEEKWVGSR